MPKVLRHSLKTNPGYSVFVTGHSLGGALASLFAFRCACRKDIPKPVRCITHAQPLVGDFRLLQSVRKLEKSNNLILLRTRNCEDGVPAVPAFSPGPKFTYTHIGMELKMYDDNRSKNIKLSKSEKKVKNFALNCKALIKLFVIKAGQDKQKRAHSLREHIRRLEKYEKEIRSLGDKLEDVVSTKNPVILWMHKLGVPISCHGTLESLERYKKFRESYFSSSIYWNIQWMGYTFSITHCRQTFNLHTAFLLLA